MKKKLFEIRAVKMRERLTGQPTIEPDVVAGTPFSIKQCAQKLGRTPKWTRNYFKNRVSGVLIMPGSGKRGTRKYETITVPPDVLDRVIQKFTRN